LKYLILSLCVLLSGCVQVPGDTSKPALPNLPSPSTPDGQFRGVDETLVARILQSPELQDAARLRRYAALYRGLSETVQQPELLPMQVLQGGIKATEQFIKPRSAAMQAILVSHLPKPPLSDSDRQRIVDAFGSLSLACHAAAHRLETGGK